MKKLLGSISLGETIERSEKVPAILFPDCVKIMQIGFWVSYVHMEQM